MTQFIAYYRVSTQRQGQSGLGLEAQQAAVAAFVGSTGVLSSFTEVESGRKCNRPQLAEALAECKRTGATLVIAKLDRLARNVHFITGLLESGVDIVTVSELLGHSNINLTAKRYSHPSPSHKQAAVEALVAQKAKKSDKLLTEILPERPDKAVH